MLSARFAHLVATQLYMYYTVCTILYGVKIALCTHPLLLDVLRTGVSFKKTTNTKQVAILHPAQTLSWITLHDGSQHWHHHDHQYWHNIGAAPALTLAHSLAQHDHKLIIKTNVFVTSFVLFCFVLFFFCSLLWISNRKVCPHG